MSNTFVTLPVPSGDGFGAWVDTSAIGPSKTISVDGGAFAGQLYIEASNDAQASAFPADCGPFAGPTFAPQEFSEACQYMRVRRVGSSVGALGTPSVGVGGAAASATTYAAMNVPSGDGVGTATDLTGGGDVNTFAIVGAPPRGAQIFIETSTDGVNFSPTLLFDVGHGAAQTVRGVLNSARVRVRGAIAPIASLVSVGSATAAGGGAAAGVNAVHAGTAISITGTGADPIVNNIGVTSNVAGAGISVSGATGAVTITNTGVTSAVAGAGVAVSGATGAVTFSNTGVLSIVAGTGISVSGATGNVTVTATGAVFPGYGGAPPAVGTSAAGTATTVSRSDHTHTGVASVTAGTAISITGTASAPIVNNTGVTSIVAGSGIGISGATGAVTISVTGGAFPGFGGAPPSIAVASAAGTSGLAAQSDHTHAGVGSAVAGTGIGVSAATGAVTFTNTGVTSIVAGTGITVSGATGAVTVNATATSFPGFGGPPPAVASASATGSASTASHSDHTHAQDLSVVYAPSLAAGQVTGVFQQTYAAPNATPSVLNVATGRVPFGNAGVLTTSAGLTFATATNTLSVVGTETFTMNANGPFVGWNATAAAANTSTVMRFAMQPPAVASGAGHALDAYSWDSVTVNVTGNAGQPPVAIAHFQSPTYNQTGTSTISVAATVQIDPPIKSGTGTWTMSAALYINDPNATGNANIIVNDIVYTPKIVGGSGLGDQPLSFAVVSTDTMSWLTGVALDGSGGNTEGSLSAGIWSLGRTAAVSINTTGDVLVGSTAGLAAAATAGFPYIPTSTALLTGAPNAFSGIGAPIAFDSNDHLLFLRNIAGSQWEVCPTFNSTAAAGAGTVVFTNAPTGIVSLTPKWWTFKTPAGVQTYIPYLQ